MSTVSRRRFVRSAPSRADKRRSVDLRVTRMTARDAAWWDTRVGSKHLRMSGRPDRYWPWSIFLPMCHLIELAQQRYCRALVIWARADNGLFVRAGMSMLIEGYPYLDATTDADSYFVWFISSADPDILKRDFQMSHPPALGRVLLDNAIVLSQHAGSAGRIGLHAAPAGGEGLVQLYGNCGLVLLPREAPLPLGVRGKNDGRFLYADEHQAELLAQLLDPRR
jgi:hypothetical protein